jgi:hypothetical protein
MKIVHASQGAEFLRAIRVQFDKLKLLGDRAFMQLEEADFHYRPDAESNSVAILIQHLHGNLQSRFTDFLTSDGEKPSRNRDQEFIDQGLDQESLLARWEEGWKSLFVSLEDLDESDLSRIILIRNEPHTVIEAISRCLQHVSYHVGQIVMLSKHIRQTHWQSLSIPKGKSSEFNRRMFNKK